MTDPTKTADCLRTYAKSGKPILASWMGGNGVAAGVSILNQAGIPTFSYPDMAAHVFVYMWRYTYNLRGLYETPAPAGQEEYNTRYIHASRVIHQAHKTDRALLTEYESKQLLSVYDIPTVETRLATNETEAVQQANEIGYPVVVKLHSEILTHKTDVGGVKLNLPNAESVQAAYREIETSVREQSNPEYFQGVTVQPMVRLDGYEVILGSSVDPQFGPVLLFGTGGQLVEVFKDSSLALPPLNTTLARRMMEQTRIYKAFKGVRGRKPVDMAALEQLLVRFSQLVAEHPRIKEIDINPLLVSAEQLLALDARVILHGREVPPEKLPRPVIRPYPSHYILSWTMNDGTKVTIRPIRPEDEPLLVKFHESLTELSVYQRYLNALKLSQRVAHERLARMCFIDYAREMALVAELKNPQTGERNIIAVGRLIKEVNKNEAEFALLVSDVYQGKGLGTELLLLFVEVWSLEKFRRIISDFLPENRVMQHVSKKVGFQLRHDDEEDVVKAAIDL